MTEELTLDEAVRLLSSLTLDEPDTACETPPAPDEPDAMYEPYPVPEEPYPAPDEPDAVYDPYPAPEEPQGCDAGNDQTNPTAGAQDTSSGFASLNHLPHEGKGDSPTPRVLRPSSRWHVQTGSEVEPKPVEFLWNPYLPIGEVTMVMAAGGVGKTFALCGIAAEMSRGRRPLNGLDRFEPVHTLFISAEDRASVLRERLEKSGADLGFIHILDDAASVGLSLAADNGQELCGLIQATGARLVVLDPLHAFIGDIDINRVNAVRPVMHALAAVAKAADCSIVIVSHVSKRQSDGNANNMAIGSVDLVNACRSVLRIAGDETGQSPNRRVLVQTKSNYAAYGASIAYEIADDGMRWLGFSVLTRDLLEAASLSRQKLSEYLLSQNLSAAKDDELTDALLSLCRGQTKEREFYAYKTLRERWPGMLDHKLIKPALERVRVKLAEKGVRMEFGRENTYKGSNDRGVYLIRKQNRLFEG